MFIVKLKESFDSGVEKVKEIASLFSERLKVEAAVIKLLRESGDLEKKRASLVKEIGERVFDLRGRSEINVYEDGIVKETLGELEKLDAEITELKKKASEISKVE
jgi:seryl-tRNA synthetase